MGSPEHAAWWVVCEREGFPGPSFEEWLVRQLSKHGIKPPSNEVTPS